MLEQNMSVNIIKSNIVTVVTVLNFPRKIVWVVCAGWGCGTWYMEVTGHTGLWVVFPG